MKDQLFKNNPDIQIISKLLSYFGIKDFDDNHLFTKKNLIDLKTVQNIENNIDELKKYYLPCKSKIYLNNITEKRAIVILRQFIRYYNYNINSKEKYSNGLKFNCYYICKNNIIHKNKSNINRKYIIEFN